MNNYNNTYIRPPRKSVIILASLVFAVIFSLAAYSAYVQQTDQAHSVHLSPTSANYGTLSTARPQALAVPMQSTAPFLSGGEIRSYAYNGHATMPKATSAGSGFKIHTTSSATVHTIGSGGGGTGGSVMSGGSNSSTSSSKGISYSGGVSIPTLALNNAIVTTSGTIAQTSAPLAVRPRRVRPNGDGEYNGEPYNGQWWYEDGEEWVDEPFEGAIRYNEDGMERYDGSNWIPVGNQHDPGVPVGNAPWLLLLFLAGIYARHKKAIRIQPK